MSMGRHPACWGADGGQEGAVTQKTKFILRGVTCMTMGRHLVCWGDDGRQEGAVTQKPKFIW